MDNPVTSTTRISRIDQRNRRIARNALPKKQGKKVQVGAKEEVDRSGAVVGPFFTHDEIRNLAMGRSHQSFHRRAPQADAVTSVVTVNVQVVSTVDPSGNVLGRETRTQADPPQSTPIGPTPAPPASRRETAPAAMGESAAVSVAAAPSSPALPPQVPAVPPFPTNALPAVPTVPAVPPFPSNLRVPAVPSYPWPSGVSVFAAVASTQPPVTSPAPTTLASSVPASVASAPLSNSTVSSSSSLSISRLTSSDSRSTSTSQPVAQSSQTLSSEIATTSASSNASRAVASSTAGGPTFGGGGGAPNTASAPPAETTAPVAAGSSGSNSSLPTPKVVGSVVGSLAGAAFILAIILLLLRRHKRKRRGALQLPEDEHHDDAQPMTQDTRKSNRIPSAFLHRFSGLSRSTAETSTSGGERSFQRVSGRKLPSAFSEGMTSEQFSRGGTMSGTSFYQDDQGTYGSQGLSKELGKEIGVAPLPAGAGTMNIRQGPARTPVVRHPDDDANPFADPAPFPRAQTHLSPPQSPSTDQRRGTLGRSLQSADGSRSSKFTENV